MNFTKRNVLVMPWRRHRPDYNIVLIVGVLLLFGLIVIYSISPALAQRSVDGVGEYHFVYRQLAFIGIGVCAFFAGAFFPLKLWRQILPLLVVVTLATFLLLPIIGAEYNGATRWIDVGFFTFQPVELAKITLVIYLAQFLSERIRLQTINNTRHTLWPALGILIGVGLFVVIFQKDLGTMISIVMILLSMLFISGINLRDFSYLGASIAGLGAIAVLLFPHRISRLTVFLHPETDTESTGYHINQALIAIGSGGWLGRGLGKSVQVFGYLPEPANDSIFAIFAEKFGLIGSLFVLLLYGALLFRLLKIVPKAPNEFSRLISVGVFAWIFSHIVINIGAMLGLLPVTGITLPFLSLGGSSLVFMMLGLGIVFNVSRYTSLSPTKKEERPNAHYANRGRHGRPRYAASRYSS